MICEDCGKAVCLKRMRRHKKSRCLGTARGRRRRLERYIRKQKKLDKKKKRREIRVVDKQKGNQTALEPREVVSETVTETPKKHLF